MSDVGVPVSSATRISDSHREIPFRDFCTPSPFLPRVVCVHFRSKRNIRLSLNITKKVILDNCKSFSLLRHQFTTIRRQSIPVSSSTPSSRLNGDRDGLSLK